MELVAVLRVINGQYDWVDIGPRGDDTVSLHVSSHEYPAPPTQRQIFESPFMLGLEDDSATLVSKV